MATMDVGVARLRGVQRPIPLSDATLHHVDHGKRAYAMASLQWETIRQSEGGIGRLRRAKVPNGWLITQAMSGEPTSLIFLPDPNHAWEVDVEKEGTLPEGRGWDKR